MIGSVSDAADPDPLNTHDGLGVRGGHDLAGISRDYIYDHRLYACHVLAYHEFDFECWVVITTLLMILMNYFATCEIMKSNIPSAWLELYLTFWQN